MTIKELKEAIASLPDDMPVAIYESLAESSGFAHMTEVCNGKDEAPYDKGMDLYLQAEDQNMGISPQTKILIIYA